MAQRVTKLYAHYWTCRCTVRVASSTQSHANPAHYLAPYFVKVYFIIIIPYSLMSSTCNLRFRFPYQNAISISHISSSSSSFYWASVANAPNVLQPYWLIVLPLDIPDLTASLLLWGPSGQKWRCLWTFLFSNVPTFATSRLQEIPAAKGGTTWVRNGRWILPENVRLPRNIQWSFTCRKSTTWDRRLYFPSEERRAEDFFRPEKSNGFVRVWTRELGYQMPARYV